MGSPGPVGEGQDVTLMCRTSGARPAATINWYNGTQPLLKAHDDVMGLEHVTAIQVSLILSSVYLPSKVHDCMTAASV